MEDDLTAEEENKLINEVRPCLYSIVLLSVFILRP
jgi:hypothetical protein